ncbi:coiled-coil domain-containing protein [Oceanirhabdus seepicola]|uniref:Uncharacterized protein n=1 Tax=Oceanirhabdus seepicola TaxID=2828781 RepID=A0A9J6P1B9_9CLOT|nr:hypothetical protein [Oceanirhabdus seepicola]MCM1990455.1 hypothetical protein [Oceanirhabdus seepicola]
MNKIRKFIVICSVFLVVSLSLSSCKSEGNNEINELKNTLSQTQSQLQDKEEDLEETKIKLNELKKEMEKLKIENEKLLSDDSIKEKNIDEATYEYYKQYFKHYSEQEINIKNKLRNQAGVIAALKEGMNTEDIDFMPLYDVDANSMIKYVSSYCIMSKNLELEEKLQELAYNLSLYVFDGLPINVESIKNEGNKKIAYINLKEKYERKGAYYPSPSWANNRFQGSSGGAATITKLVSAFLQPDYDGEWIDGVKFLYEGKDIQFQHVQGLEETIYREIEGKKDVSILEYFPIEKINRKYTGGFENGGYTEVIKEKFENKLLVEHSDTAVKSASVYEIGEDYVKRIYSSGEGYDENKNYFNEKSNLNYTVLKGPLKIGSSWKNNNSVSIITGIDQGMYTKIGYVNALEITTIFKGGVVRDYYVKGIGFVKEEYDRAENDMYILRASELKEYELLEKDDDANK